MQVIVSDVGLAIAFAALGYVGYKCGVAAVVKYYAIPYLWVNVRPTSSRPNAEPIAHFLRSVALACLHHLPFVSASSHSNRELSLISLRSAVQHTDPQLPHYREGAFNFQRGACVAISTYPPRRTELMGLAGYAQSLHH